MPRLLRVTEARRWDFVEDLPAWVPAGDIPAAPLGDLKPSPTSKISVWLVEDGEPNLNRVIAGIAAGRQSIDKLDVLLVDRAQVENLPITCVKTPGDSKDGEANGLWHFDLVELTFTKLRDLIQLLAQHGEGRRWDEDAVKELIVASVKANHIKLVDLKESVRDEVQEALAADAPAG